MSESKDRIIVNLGVSTVEEAMRLVSLLREHVGGFKISFELLAAMLASVMVAVHLRGILEKIHSLFSLLGNHDAFDTLRLVSKVSGADCSGIVFPRKGGIILIGRKGEKLLADKLTDKEVNKCFSYFVGYGKEITHATDPVAAAKRVANELDAYLRMPDNAMCCFNRD